MWNRKILHILLLISAMLVFGGCSNVKVKLAKDIMPDNLRSVAILPVEYPGNIQREKVDAIVKSVRQELRNKNFVVLADRLVDEVCLSPACPERKILADKYQVDAFVSVVVGSVTRTNFLAGFYNAIKGKLILTNVNSQPLVEVEHTQSEKGGLLFNSSQIIQAVISYSNNTEADSFSKLSTGFAQTLVSKVPRPKEAIVNKDAVAVEISNVQVKQIRPEVFQICADATPDSLVSVLVNRISTNLRAVSEGKYCGSFLYNQISAGATPLVAVEARSPFGNSVRKDIDIAKEVDVCDLNNNVILTEKNGRPSIQIACVDVNGPKNVLGNCQDKIDICPGNKFIVFRATSGTGPYEKVAEIRSTSWTDNSARKGSETYYELVSVNKAGVWSLPVTAKPVASEG